MDTNGISLADIASVVDKNRNTWGDGAALWVIILILFLGGGNLNRQGGPAPQPNAATSGEVQSGFDHQAVMAGLNDINGNVNRGFSDAEVSRCTKVSNIINGITNAAYAAQQGISDVSNKVSAEGAATRSAMDQGFARAAMDLNDKVQKILDKLCQQEIETKNDEINQLRQQLYMAQLAASQGAQTSRVNDNTDAQIASAVNQLKTPAPVPAYIVGNPYGCNCGTQFGNGCCA